MNPIQEVERLCRLAAMFRGQDDDHSDEQFLVEVLQGRERTAGNLVKLFGFVTKFAGQGSGLAERLWRVIEPLLKESGVDAKQLKQIRYPDPQPGDPKFRSVLDELCDEGHDIPKEYLSPTTKRRLEK